MRAFWFEELKPEIKPEYKPETIKVVRPGPFFSPVFTEIEVKK